MLATALAAVPRVAVVADTPEAQAVLVAELSKGGRVAVVERDTLARLMGERTRQSLNQGGGSVEHLPEPVDFFLRFHQAGERLYTVEIVNCPGGDVLGSRMVSLVLPDNAKELAREAMDLLERRSAQPEASARVAVLEVGKGGEDVFLFAARLRAALLDSGVMVLDRAVTPQVVIENQDAIGGMRAGAAEGEYRGADYLVQVRATEGAGRIEVIDVRSSRLVDARNAVLGEGEKVAEVLRWIRPLLGAHQKKGEETDYVPAVETEALEPFYRGLKLFEVGKYAEATAEFGRARLCNGGFRDAMLWEARCYEALDMKPLADATRRSFDMWSPRTGSPSPDPGQLVDDVAFLGVAGVSENLSASVAAAAASALVAGERPVRLPENLGALRREFDWIAGASNGDGESWQSAGSQFCRIALSGSLRVEEGRAVVSWNVRDTITGQIVSSEDQLLEADPALWRDQMGKTLPALLSRTAAEITRLPAPPAPETESPVQLRDNLRKARGLEANVALLKLVRANPADPTVLERGFEKGQSKRDGLDAFLNFALRDWVIARLPTGSFERRRAELARILAFHPTQPTGRYITGTDIDYLASLLKLAGENPFDPPGLAARYLVLFDQQDETPLPLLIQRCEELIRDLDAADRKVFFDADWLMRMTDCLRQFAVVASGDGSAPLPAVRFEDYPRWVKVNEKWGDALDLVKESFWVTNEGLLLPLTPEERIIEARAALAVNGRPSEQRRLLTNWLKEYPHSMIMTAYAIECLSQIGGRLGWPIAHPLDWPAERAAYLELVDYAIDNLEWALARCDNRASLNTIEEMTWRLFMGLNMRGYLGVVDDAHYLRLRDRMAESVRAARERLGGPPWPGKERNLIAWQSLTPEMARDLRSLRLASIGIGVYDPDAVRQDILQNARATLVGEKFDPHPWWQVLRESAANVSLSAPDLAACYSRLTPNVIQLYEKSPLNAKDAGFLLEHGMALFYGNRLAEAEEVFRLILRGVDASGKAKMMQAIQANAAYRLVQVLRLSHRKAEAIEMAHEALALCGGTSWGRIDRVVDDHMAADVETRYLTGGLAGDILRQLREMRLDPAAVRLPDRVAMVTVPTPNADNPELAVYYRVPPLAGRGSAPLRVLVLVPVAGSDVRELLKPQSVWAQFADRMGWVLVTPQFCNTNYPSRADNIFAYYVHASAWSGKALLDALEKIGDRVPIEGRRLLFYSYSSGSGFASSFARWRPELTSAVAVTGTTVLAWPMYRPGLKPYPALKGVRFWVAVTEGDDLSANFYDRRATAEAFVTLLRGAGVETDWKVFPGTAHLPTREMEEDAQAFLARQAGRW
ncbi:MAG: hypothetical protein J0I10_20900 [Verrucomicrobia bacterium]|nr:hypothetical protein [Verrucomicrobiota bacterium]